MADINDTLKKLARSAAQDEQADQPAFGAWPPPPDELLASTDVATVFVMAMLDAALPRRTLARIHSSGSLALVVEVPGADWVEPVADALKSARQWNEILRRAGTSKLNDKPSNGGDRVSAALSEGGSVLGVSPSPERYLPTALVSAADLRVSLGRPTPRVLRATIALVTGMRPGSLPPDVALGLGLDEIVSCIRTGTSSRECVRRLRAASASKRSPATDLADVPPIEETYGYGAAKDHALALIAAVGEYRSGEREWCSIEGRNIVLAGPPGVGKTVFARSLAKSLGVRLTATSVSTWFSQTSGYLNDICKKIDEVFIEASQAGGVLLIDECDSIPNRNNCESIHRDYWVNLVSHILMTLDGATSSPASRLIIVGATNFPERLDPALTRPGRLDRIVHIGLPDADAIQGILRQHLRGDLADADLAPLALVGAGATGAEIAAWAAGARMSARAGRRPMALSDLLGQMAPSDTRPPDVQLSVARHEAAHAIATEALHVGHVRAMSLVARGSTAGHTICRPKEAQNRTAAELDDLVVTILAGRAADERWGDVTSGSAGGPGSDLAMATRLVAAKFGTWCLGPTLLHLGDQVDALLQVRNDPSFRRVVEDDLARLYRIARDVVEEHAPAIDRLARRLVSARVLGGDEVRGIIGMAEARLGEGGAAVTVGGPHG